MLEFTPGTVTSVTHVTNVLSGLINTRKHVSDTHFGKMAKSAGRYKPLWMIIECVPGYFATRFRIINFNMWSSCNPTKLSISNDATDKFVWRIVCYILRLNILKRFITHILITHIFFEKFFNYLRKSTFSYGGRFCKIDWANFVVVFKSNANISDRILCPFTC